MDKNYLNILKVLNDNGYKAYLVGGCVRDYLIKSISLDVDIITNATPMEVSKLFNVKTVNNEYGSVKINAHNNIVDITTFRRELSYKNGKPTKIEYIDSLEEDLKRRDFTMNTIVMDREYNIIDIMGGIKDIKSNIIRPVKDPKILFKEDPSRLLRGLRFMSILEMNLDKSIIDYIKHNKKDFELINSNKKKEEFDKLFKSKKCARFINFVKDYNLEEYLGIKINTFNPVDNLISNYAQLEFKNLPFTRLEKEQIKSVKKLIKKGNIGIYDVYKYGLFISSSAALVLNIPLEKINLMYTNLPINSIIEINIKSEEVLSLLNIKPGRELGSILHKLEKEIVTGKLKNEKESIIERLKSYE